MDMHSLLFSLLCHNRPGMHTLGVARPSKVELVRAAGAVKNATTTESYIHLGTNLATPLLNTILNSLFMGFSKAGIH